MQPNNSSRGPFLIQLCFRLLCVMEVTCLILVISALAIDETKYSLHMVISAVVPFIIWISYFFFNCASSLLLERVFGASLETRKSRRYRRHGTAFYMAACVLAGASALSRLFETPNYSSMGLYWILVLIAAVVALPGMMHLILYIRMIIKCIQDRSARWESQKGAQSLPMAIKTIREFLLVSIMNFGFAAAILLGLPIWCNFFAMTSCPIYYWFMRRVVLNVYSISRSSVVTNGVVNYLPDSMQLFSFALLDLGRQPKHYNCGC